MPVGKRSGALVVCTWGAGCKQGTYDRPTDGIVGGATAALVLLLLQLVLGLACEVRDCRSAE
jgi:hypothetical protein